MCADAEFWHNHTVVEEEGHRTQNGKIFKQSNRGSLEREYMRAEQGLQHGRSLWKEYFKAQPID